MTSFDSVILGAAGYGGGELLRLLLDHPGAETTYAISKSHADKSIDSAHPSLRGFYSQPFRGQMDWSLLATKKHPVVFSAQPHGELAKSLGELQAAWEKAGIADRVLLIDLSGDYRIQDPIAFAKAYGGEHPSPQYIKRFVYGCPEANREAIRKAHYIANPGCFATALNLALLPLVSFDIPFVAVSGATGSSGSGAKAQAGTHHPERMTDFRAYKVLKHQHQAEVVQLLAAQGASRTHLAFVPQSAPIVRGIFVTAQLELPEGLDISRLKAHYQAYYEWAPFIRMVPDSPRVGAVAGTNFAEISVHGDEKSAAILVAIDNLGKGMAGQAIQNMNLALGVDEKTGLWRPGRWPN